MIFPWLSITAKMGDHLMLDLDEWALVLAKMLRFHYNISEEIKTIVQTIRTEMKPELVPVAEDKSNFGKVVKKAIREMWSLEHEVDDLQVKFAESIGTMDLDNLDVDFIEDMMLKAKPLQSVLNCIRARQIVRHFENYFHSLLNMLSYHFSPASPKTSCPNSRHISSGQA